MTCQVIIMYRTLTFCCTMAPFWRQGRRQCHNRPNINHIDTSDMPVCVWIYSTNNTSELIVSLLLGSGSRPYVGYTHFLKAIHPWVSLLFCKYQIVSELIQRTSPKSKTKLPSFTVQWERKLRPNIYLGNGNDNDFVASYFDSITHIEARFVMKTCMLQAKSTLNHL